MVSEYSKLVQFQSVTRNFVFTLKANSLQNFGAYFGNPFSFHSKQLLTYSNFIWNRQYSPFAQKFKTLFVKAKNVLMVNKIDYNYLCDN